MSLRALAFVALVFAPFALAAQSYTTEACTGGDDFGHDHSWFSKAHACELRRATLPVVDGRLAVEGMNGSIEVIGEARPDISLEAKVVTQGGSQDEAQSLLKQITIKTRGTIEADGPRNLSGRGWSVSYRLRVPHELAADLRTANGSISLSTLKGAIEGTTTNGSVKINNLAGDVHLQTTNGSIQAMLEGSGWEGRGLSATTTNGGIEVNASPNYSAHLIASTTNGGVHVERAGAGDTRGRHVDVNLGNGGPTLVLQTTNGGIKVQ